MKIDCIVNGDLFENCYIISDKDNNAIIIDPGMEIDKVTNFIDENHFKVVCVLVTHYHFDHVTILDEIVNKYKCKVIDYKSEENQKIKSFNFSIIKNYGHTMDSVSFYFKKDKVMFTGDFIFRGSIGKYSSKNEIEMYKSLTEFIKLDDDIKIFPGHGTSSTIGEEKKYNYFLRGI